MNDRHEVISAFLDDEPFDPQQLANVLDEPAGRALLIDLVALRHLVRPDEAIPPGLWTTRRAVPLRTWLAAAAVLVALVGGYSLGQHRSPTVVSKAPAPTRVVQGPAAWRVPPTPTPTMRSAQ